MLQQVSAEWEIHYTWTGLNYLEAAFSSRVSIDDYGLLTSTWRSLHSGLVDKEKTIITLKCRCVKLPRGRIWRGHHIVPAWCILSLICTKYENVERVSAFESHVKGTWLVSSHTRLTVCTSRAFEWYSNFLVDILQVKTPCAASIVQFQDYILHHSTGLDKPSIESFILIRLSTVFYSQLVGDLSQKWLWALSALFSIQLVPALMWSSWVVFAALTGPCSNCTLFTGVAGAY